MTKVEIINKIIELQKKDKKTAYEIELLKLLRISLDAKRKVESLVAIA